MSGLPKRLFGLLALAGLVACAALVGLARADVASAEPDDDIPGITTTVGATVSGTVDAATDTHDVYAVQLRSGEEVQFVTTDSRAGYSSGIEAELIAPGATSIHGSYRWVAKLWADTEGHAVRYTPAKDGVYFIHVEANKTGVTYSVAITRTSTPAVTTEDSNDIFGVPIGLGPVTGVVDAVTDTDDVYALTLFAGEEVQFLTVDPKKGIGSSGIEAELIAPGATSVHGSYTWVAKLHGDKDGYAVRYTPAKDGVYFIHVEANWYGVVYSITVSGSAEKPPYPTLLALRSSSTKVRKGSSVTLSATLRTSSGDLVVDQDVTLLRSYDGRSWQSLQTLSSSSGRYSVRTKVSRKTWFKMRFDGNEDYAAAQSRTILVKVY